MADIKETQQQTATSTPKRGSTAPRGRKTTSGARQSVSDSYAAVRERAAAALAESREKAGAAVDDSPIVAVAGGLALGALLAALLPRSEREIEYLGPIGNRITGTARNSVEAAREAARAAIGDLGASGQGGGEKILSLIQTAIKTASAASDAARGSLRK